MEFTILDRMIPWVIILLGVLIMAHGIFFESPDKEPIFCSEYAAELEECRKGNVEVIVGNYKCVPIKDGETRSVKLYKRGG